MEKTISVEWGCASRIGARVENQDAFAVSGCVAVVADGVAGSDLGGLAARVAANSCSKAMKSASLKAAAMFGHEQIRVLSEILSAPDEKLSAQTALALLRVGDKLEAAAVGDVHVYVLRRGRIVEVCPGGRADGGGLDCALGAEVGYRFLLRKIRCSERVLEDGDIVLACTDGVWERPSFEAETISLAAEASSAPCFALRLADRLVGPDNATVVAGFVRR